VQHVDAAHVMAMAMVLVPAQVALPQAPLVVV
jgi:hypothetical protein